MYNQMVEPLTRLSVKGFLWWQGEAEVLIGIAGYECLFKARAPHMTSLLRPRPFFRKWPCLFRFCTRRFPARGVLRDC